MGKAEEKFVVDVSRMGGFSRNFYVSKLPENEIKLKIRGIGSLKALKGLASIARWLHYNNVTEFYQVLKQSFSPWARLGSVRVRAKARLEQIFCSSPMTESLHQPNIKATITIPHRISSPVLHSLLSRFRLIYTELLTPHG